MSSYMLCQALCGNIPVQDGCCRFEASANFGTLRQFHENELSGNLCHAIIKKLSEFIGSDAYELYGN